jgi:hypothetical protein
MLSGIEEVDSIITNIDLALASLQITNDKTIDLFNALNDPLQIVINTFLPQHSSKLSDGVLTVTEAKEIQPDMRLLRQQKDIEYQGLVIAAEPIKISLDTADARRRRTVISLSSLGVDTTDTFFGAGSEWPS